MNSNSRNKLRQLHPSLQRIVSVAEKRGLEFEILEGYRNAEKQLEYYNSGASKVKLGKHNVYPAEAMDIYPKGWDESEKSIRQLFFLTGCLKMIAVELGIALRQGHDWNQNNDTTDERFIDAFHQELL